MAELFWLVKMGFCVWIAWRATVMLDVGNPLMAVFFAMVLMILGPIGFNWLLEAKADFFSDWGVSEIVNYMPLGAPMAFALIGTLLWSGVEAITGR